MISSVKLKQNGKLFETKATFGRDEIFLFKNSLPVGVEPKVGDEILLDFENAELLVNSVQPLISSKSELDNYVLGVEVK